MMTGALVLATAASIAALSVMSAASGSQPRSGNSSCARRPIIPVVPVAAISGASAVVSSTRAVYESKRDRHVRTTAMRGRVQPPVGEFGSERWSVAAATSGTMPTVRTVFLHGAGRAGRAAWAAQSAVEQDGWLFLDRGPSGDVPSTDARRIVAALDGSGHVVAASYGGVAAMLAAEQHPEAVRSLVLFEPACFSLARGGTRRGRARRRPRARLRRSGRPGRERRGVLAALCRGVGHFARRPAAGRSRRNGRPASRHHATVGGPSQRPCAWARPDARADRRVEPAVRGGRSSTRGRRGAAPRSRWRQPPPAGPS